MPAVQLHHLFTSPGHNYFGHHGRMSGAHEIVEHDSITLIGRTFSIDGIRFEGTEECRPCYWMDEACGKPGTEEIMKGRGGLRCRILDDGTLKRGPAELVYPPR